MDLAKYNIIELSENEVLSIYGGTWLSNVLGFIYETIVIAAEAVCDALTAHCEQLANIPAHVLSK